LFSELVQQDAGENVFISPASVALALAMTCNGASGTTQEAMGKTLELPGLSREELNQANAALESALESPNPDVQLTLANSLWARQGIPFRPEFLRRNQDFYRAEVVELDFDDPGAPKTINDWVNRKTHGKISQMVERIGPTMVLYLINAIYFKGKWAKPFDQERTRERPFTRLDDTTRPCPMMEQQDRFPYYRGESFQAVRLPYGQGRLSMYLFLPDKGSRLEAFQKGLTAERWNQWMSRFREKEGRIVLPRFRLEYQADLKASLGALGLGVAFDRQRADFDDLSPVRPLFIGEVTHKTFVEVNEEGTEAAAATAVATAAEGVPIRERPFYMVMDRPFFCAIRDNATGMVWFMGSIVEPE
jgi:serpin B